MKLADFIRSNVENISIEWEKFAATLLPDEEFSASVLRDGIANILREIATDMDQLQSAVEQQLKSEGGQENDPDNDNAAETHALDRIRMGLSYSQLISEFRALRATVLRLWDDTDGTFTQVDIYDITRFNEAIDQALTEAVARYFGKIEKSRELFLGILGHDLRTPLGAITGLAQLMAMGKTPERTAEFANQIVISSKRMLQMINDLVELTRVRLGDGISADPQETDLSDLCRQAVAEIKAMHPKRSFNLHVPPSLPGKFDRSRMSQVLSNLLGNAVQHGSVDTPITVTAKQMDGSFNLTVHNEGPSVPPKLLPNLFDRFTQGQAGMGDPKSENTSLGLGLYIAKEIVTAHQGTISAHSTEADGTTFTVVIHNSV